MESDRRVGNSRIERQINENPLEWNQKLKSADSIKGFPGLGDDDLPRLQKIASSAMKASTGTALDEFNDGLATDKFKTDEEIERAFTGRVSPSIVQGMKSTRASQFNEVEAARLKSPEVQNQMMGEVSRSLDGLHDASSKDFENRYSKATFLLSQLKDSPEKIRLNDQLKATKGGREAEVKNHADAAFKALKSYNDRERANIPKASQITTRKLAEDGFLKNAANLTAGGLSEKDAVTIVDLAKEKGNSVAQAKLKELWPKRGAGAVNADPMVIATLDALRGDNATVPWNDPRTEDAAIAANLEADRREGERNLRLSEFLRVNPEAKPAEIDAKVLEIGGEQTHRELKSGIYDRKTSMATPQGGFVPGETVMNIPDSLTPLRSVFIEEGLKNGIDPRFLAAVSMHETAGGKSSAFRNKNNAMGVSDSRGPIEFGDASDSVRQMARLLASTSSGPYKNAKTIAEIASIYAPVGAENDPGNLNSSWTAGVSKYYKQLGGNPLSVLK